MNIEKPSLETLLKDKNFTNMVDALSHTALKSSYRFSKSHPIVTRQDLVSEGITAACSVYKNFDPSKGAWASYTYMYVMNAMKVFCKKFCHQLSISEGASRDHLAEMTNVGIVHIDQMFDKLDDGKFDIPGCSGVEIVEFDESFYFRGLSKIEIDMFKYHVFEDKTIQQVALKYKTSKSNVYNIIERMLSRIRERIENNEQKDANGMPELRQE